jgi:hypothetical protein
MDKSILFRVQHAYNYIFVISRPTPEIRYLRVLGLIESIINDYFRGAIPRGATGAVLSNLRLGDSLGEDA